MKAAPMHRGATLAAIRNALSHPFLIGGTIQRVGAGSILMAEWTLYFQSTGDRDSRVWVFMDDVPSKFLPRPFSCGDDNFRIRIIDLFGGRHPLLVSYEALTKEEIQIPFRPTAILDSNVVSYLHQYVTGHPGLSGQRRRTVRELLRFFVGNRLDYNPFFYYMESASGGKHSSVLSHAESLSESILRLHTMDEAHFLTSGKIRTDPRILDNYRREYGVDDFRELAAAYARSMVGPTDFRMEWISKLTYAALLKTALIHKTTKQDVPAKYEELRTFMEETLNIALGVERMLALAYFAGRFDDFVPIQRGAVPGRALSRVRSAAWDLLLLQLPAFMLVADTSGAVYLAFICTSDKALGLVAGACRIEGVIGLAPKVNVPLPIMSTDLSILEGDLGSSVVNRIREIDTSWQKCRASRLFTIENRISFEGLEDLIRELEEEVMDFCSSP